MFLLISVRHVGAHPGGHQHGVSMQISIILGKMFLWISRIRNIPDLNLGEGLCIFISFHFPDSGLNLLNGFDFDFDLFEWRDTENQQYSQLERRTAVFTCGSMTNQRQRKHLSEPIIVVHRLHSNGFPGLAAF